MAFDSKDELKGKISRIESDIMSINRIISELNILVGSIIYLNHTVGTNEKYLENMEDFLGKIVMNGRYSSYNRHLFNGLEALLLEAIKNEKDILSKKKEGTIDI